MHLHIKSLTTGGAHPCAATETIRLHGFNAVGDENMECELVVCGSLLGIVVYNDVPAPNTCQVINWRTSWLVNVRLLSSSLVFYLDVAFIIDAFPLHREVTFVPR